MVALERWTGWLKRRVPTPPHLPLHASACQSVLCVSLMGREMALDRLVLIVIY